MDDRMTQPAGPGRHFPTADEERRERAIPLRFGQFLALPAARTLLFRGKPVALGSRAFDLLVVLLRSRGEIVGRDEIVRYVWPSTIVEESNLRFQMAVLRKALGEDRERIKTVTGRGYLFVADDADDRAPSAEADTPAIVIIDQDRHVREALHHLLRPLDLRVESFVSLEAFLSSGAGARSASRQLAASGAT